MPSENRAGQVLFMTFGLTLFLFTALTGLLFCGSNQDQRYSDTKPRKSSTTSAPYLGHAIDGMTITVVKFTLIFIFSLCLGAMVIRLVNLFPWNLLYWFFLVVYFFTLPL
jgi:hypothetical protein